MAELRREDENVDEQTCSICLSDYADSGPQVKILVMPCPGEHLHHYVCIKEWLRREMACPLCKYEVTEQSFHRGNAIN